MEDDGLTNIKDYYAQIFSNFLCPPYPTCAYLENFDSRKHNQSANQW